MNFAERFPRDASLIIKVKNAKDPRVNKIVNIKNIFIQSPYVTSLS